MTSRTEGEVVKFVKQNLYEPYPGSNSLRHLRVDVTADGEGWKLVLRQMYEYVQVDFKFLSALSEFFGGTKNINDDRYHHDGCETCDYGSSYEVTLRVQP